MPNISRVARLCYKSTAVYMNVNFGITAHQTRLGYNKWTFLTYWGRVMYMCVGSLTIISLDYGLSTGRYQATIWTNVYINNMCIWTIWMLLIGAFRTNFSNISIEIRKVHSAKCISKRRLRNCGHLSRPRFVNDFMVLVISPRQVGVTSISSHFLTGDQSTNTSFSEHNWRGIDDEGVIRGRGQTWFWNK